jgi:hypothetical protein
MITLWASLAGFVVSFLLFEPFKTRRLEKTLSKMIDKHVDMINTNLQVYFRFYFFSFDFMNLNLLLGSSSHSNCGCH